MRHFVRATRAFFLGTLATARGSQGSLARLGCSVAYATTRVRPALHSRFVFGLAPIIVLGGATFLLATPPRLSLEVARLEDGRVEFPPVAQECELATAAVAMPPDKSFCGETPQFLVCLDHSHLRFALGQVAYPFLVRGQEPAGQPIYVTTIQGTTSGRIADTELKVAFVVTSGGGGALPTRGEIKLPLFGRRYQRLEPIVEGAGQPSLTRDVDSETGQVTWTLHCKVDIKGGVRIPLEIVNKSSLVPIHLDEATVVPAGGGDIWDERTGTDLAQDRQLQVEPDAKRTLNLVLRPRLGKAISDALSLKKRGPQAAATLLLLWGSEPGLDDQQELPIHIEVAFVPWLPALLLFAALGGVVGALFAVLNKIRKGNRPKLGSIFWNLLWAVVLAAIVESVGAVLALNEALELRVFDFRLDPLEILPALVLGVLLGVGRNVPWARLFVSDKDG